MSAPALDFEAFIRLGSDGLFRFDAAIEGMTCAACIGEIELALRNLPGLVVARVNYTNRRLSLEWRERDFELGGVFERLRRMGYRLNPFDLASGERAERELSKRLLRCFAIAAFAATNIMLLSVAVWVGEGSDIDAPTRDIFHGLSALIALPAAAFAGQPFFESAFQALRAKRLNMDVPISLGVVLALAMSVYETLAHAEHAYFDSAIMLLTFLLLGRYLDAAMRRKTCGVVANLAALRAPLARRLDAEGSETTIAAAVLQRGDRVLVRPGELLPADGVVVAGASTLDESSLTGETARRPVTGGERVYAGSLNHEGALQIEVEASTGGGALLDEIERLLENATAARSRYVRLADRVSGVYAPVVHVAALATGLIWLVSGASAHDALVVSIAVLIVTCPCALALAVPATHVVASGALFRAGVLLNSADALERFAQIDTVVFDKTGTLTSPRSSLVNAQDISPKIVKLAAGLARASSHPLALAVARAHPEAILIPGVTEERGQGVKALIDGMEARLGSPGFCGVEREVAAMGALASDVSIVAFRFGESYALFQLRQALKSDAATTVAALARRGLEIEILSGDRPEAVRPIAEALNVADWRGGLNPAEKVARIAALRAAGRKVLMIGDGLNDAPALASAHASMSPVEASRVTQAAADAVFLGDHLAPVFVTIETSDRARRVMRQNLALSAIYNICATPLAMLGFLTPLVAAAAMSGSSMLVTINALRIGKPSSKSPEAAS